jgi:hypothetical protein
MSEQVAGVIVFAVLILGPPALVYWFGLRPLGKALRAYNAERGGGSSLSP